ncbi:MAG: phosphodiester glycosidase family protein [Synergistaceae bacterium]|nr:phosphodiester glycosidase family protein [Synergistaceae bacterium]
MIKKFNRAILFFIYLPALILLINIQQVNAVTRAEFLTGLLSARGIDWSEAPEFINGDAPGFMLRVGYVTDAVKDLNANITRREALRWTIESLGLGFEAGLFADYPTGFKDEKKLIPFERGCLVVALNMIPAIFTKADNFRGQNPLSSKEFQIILERVRGASQNFSLDIVRNPLKGLKVFIHREGVPTGIPQWRVYLDGIKTKVAADTFKKSLKAQGLTVSVTRSENLYGVRSERLENYNQVRQLTAIAKARGLTHRILPSMTNINTSILPKFWVKLVIDPSYFKIKPLISKNDSKELLKLSELARQEKTKTAINAGFFSVTDPGRGYPIGALKINDELISQPYDNRGTLAWNNEDEAIFSVAYESEINSWYDMENIIQAGPLLLDEGGISYIDEGFNNSLLSTRHPRSVIGISEAGEWIFFVMDGRNGLHSSGATISELIEILRAQGVYSALNLDGGGSTEIIINGKIYNFPSDGRERKISYGLGAFGLD